MLKSDIKEMTETERLKLKKWDVFWHYSPAIFFLTIPIINLYFIIEARLTNNEIVYERIIDGLGLVWVFLSLSIIGFVYKYWTLKFKVLNQKVKSKHFKNAIELTEKELDWRIIRNDGNYLFAYSSNTLFSWGEQITIIRKGNKILINSICKLNQPSFFGGNQKNVDTFKRNLKASAQPLI
jgi:hypothetical protein